MDKAALNSSLQPPFLCGSSSWDTTPPSPPASSPGGGMREGLPSREEQSILESILDQLLRSLSS